MAALRAGEGRIILASGSPRRRELLRAAGIDFKVVKSRVDEHGKVPRRGRPASWAVLLATEKARDVAARNRGQVVLGADTLVVVRGKILGKPDNSKGACRMLGLLSGQWHEVVTGVAVIRGKKVLTGFERTLVKFRKFGPREINSYVASGEPLDKAGGYAIQGGARDFVERIKGDYSNVVGLPLNLVVSLLAKI